MTYKQIASMIESIGLPFTYYSFPERAPNLPYIVFYYPQNNDVSADNINYATVVQLNIELYTRNKDFDTEELIEDVLVGNGIYFAKSTEYIDAERMYQTLYTTEIVIEKE